ncbi:hypothetical protein BDP27DRAFT_1253922 [Rhodocollybia butyracea]|uniref:50S ribosomal protein L35 n=1 Tax=Rhodocollybia butyracea TaxID=206335 RepID=A0A9P5Q9F1_9AGAR|nr:hypothetical protein BDP27DRAFT_1253922 [Rhodocollybia butyracea]
MFSNLTSSLRLSTCAFQRGHHACSTVNLSRLQLFRPRMFSVSAVAEAGYKIKSHSGAKKRWRSLASGVFKRGKANHQHLNVTKSPARKNKLAQTGYSTPAQTQKLNKLLLPYGSN